MNTENQSKKGKRDIGPQSAEDLLNDVVGIVENVVNIVNYQILQNADDIHKKVSNKEESTEISLLIEEMIKRPFRRQNGRLKSVRFLLMEAIKKIELQKENANHG